MKRLLVFILLCLFIGSCIPERKDESVSAFGPTFLDRCWIPLEPDNWQTRSRSFRNWQVSMSGPDTAACPYGRAFFDIDGDNDVDLYDFSQLQLNWEP